METLQDHMQNQLCSFKNHPNIFIHQEQPLIVYISQGKESVQKVKMLPENTFKTKRILCLHVGRSDENTLLKLNAMPGSQKL